MVGALKLTSNLGSSSTIKSLEITDTLSQAPNLLLFDRAMTIACVGGIDQLREKILDLDLVNNYYMSRPSSSWTMAGLPNIHLSIFYLQRTLIR